LIALARRFITKTEELSQLCYFTAYATWNPDKVRRHRCLTSIYQDMGIEIVEDVFRKRPRKCPLCKREFTKREEKRTDVNIAVKIIELAHAGTYDIAYILSGDSDFIPAVQYVRTKHPDKVLKVIVPIDRKAEELVAACGGDSHKARIERKHLNQCLLSDPYTLSNGQTVACPTSWK
jgi:uncharacterized LabA/DUF88 family protein